MTNTALTQRALDIVAILRHVPEPLTAAVSAALQESDPDLRVAIIEGAAGAFTQRLGVRPLQALARYARHPKTVCTGAAIERLLAIETMAARWVVAHLLERNGDHVRAAAALDRIEDLTFGEERALRLIAQARNLRGAGHVEAAWTSIRQAAAAAQTKQSLAAVAQLIDADDADGQMPARARRRIAVIGTGTLQLWADALRPALAGAGILADIFIGEFGQYQQELLDPSSTLGDFKPDLIVLAVDHRALGLDDLTADPDTAVDTAVDGLRSLWHACQARYGAAVVQFTFEVPELDPFGGLSAILPGGRARLIRRVNLRLAEAAAGTHVTLFDLDEAASLFGKQRWNDSAMWIAAKQYPAAEAVPFLVHRLAGTIRAVCGLTSKCVVLDLDNTLWGGVIGEDGLNGIRLGGTAEGEAYTAFHRYLLGLKRRGIPLAVCSKNNDADARSVFREHPESLLREDDFAVFLANWEPKPDNLRRVASMLNIGIDSLVFLDDNPMERNFIRRELPEVAVPELPEDPAQYVEALHRTQLFEAVAFTDEDRNRAESYRQNAERSALAAGTTDVGEYLASLGMKVELRPFDERNLPRIVQLINKTNQFNLTTRRTTDAQVQQWMRDPHCYTQFMRLKDRFGDSGLTGILVAFREGDTLRIDTWLISCRVLGRKIEDVMLASVCAFARDTGARRVAGEFIATAKNGQVSAIYPRFGFDTVHETPEGARYELPVERAPLAPAGLHDIDDATAVTAVASGDRTR